VNHKSNVNTQFNLRIVNDEFFAKLSVLCGFAVKEYKQIDGCSKYLLNKPILE